MWWGNYYGKGRTWDDPTTLCRELCKNGWTDWFAVWVVDSGEPKEAQVPMRDIGATWRIRLNGLSAVVMRPYVKLLWPLLSTRRLFIEPYDSVRACMCAGTSPTKAVTELNHCEYNRIGHTTFVGDGDSFLKSFLGNSAVNFVETFKICVRWLTFKVSWKMLNFDKRNYFNVTASCIFASLAVRSFILA